MKVGDYVRTKKGEIGKIIDFINEPTDYYFNCYMTNLKNFTDKYITEYNDIKSSPNIIDLIEVGDYVNGECVINVDSIEVYTRDGMYLNEDIKSIVTREIFESMEYKL